MEKIIENATIFYKNGIKVFYDAISISESGVFIGNKKTKNNTTEKFVNHTFIPRNQIERIIIFDKQRKIIDIDL